jgi:hypothetical protein
MPDHRYPVMKRYSERALAVSILFGLRTDRRRSARSANDTSYNAVSWKRRQFETSRIGSMRISWPVGGLLLTAVLYPIAGSVAKAADNDKPLFAKAPVMICAGSSFLAGVLEHPPRLAVVRVHGGRAPAIEEVPVEYDGVYGIWCDLQRVELLVLDDGSDHFSRLPFAIRGEFIQRETSSEVSYSISEKGPTPPEIDLFHEPSTHLARTTGSWYFDLIVPDSKNRYELHFVRTRTHTQGRSGTGTITNFTLDLQEMEPFFGGKVIKTFPLIKYSNFEG